MKYCVKCGNPMEDDMLFCQKCGAQVAAAEAMPVADAVGLHMRDAKSGTEIELTKDGVRIFCAQGSARARFDQTIRYGDIADVRLRRAAGKSGSLSIIAADTEGAENATRRKQSAARNTISFSEKEEADAESIYNALGDLCHASFSPPIQPKRHHGCLIAFLAVLVVLCAMIAIPLILVSNAPPAAVDVILDVTQFANIGGEELIALLGQPDAVYEGTCTGTFDIPCVYYDYDSDEKLGEVSFALVNDSVVRLTSYHDYAYAGAGGVMAAFGVEMAEGCTAVIRADTVQRYRCPSAAVDDFWIGLIEGDAFGFLQVTYDMEYYEEWYLPMTANEKAEYRANAKLMMESMLTAPKSASFPLDDWKYGKNLFYISISSYVDAQNAFGVEMRNSFTFVYSRLTGELVLAIVNDEAVANNGYVATETLLRELYAAGKAEAEHAPASQATQPKDDVASVDTIASTEALAAAEPPQSTASESLPMPAPPTEEVTADAHNTVAMLEAAMRSICDAYVPQTLVGTLSFSVPSATEVDLLYTVHDAVYAGTEASVDAAEDEIMDYVIAGLNAAELPEIVTVGLSASYTVIESDGGFAGHADLDGILSADFPAESHATSAEWVSEDELGDYGLASCWMGEEIWIFGQADNAQKYIIDGAPRSQFESGVEYVGDCNGMSIRFRYNGGIEFCIADLVLAGIL